MCISIKALHEAGISSLEYGGEILHTQDDERNYYDLWTEGKVVCDGEEVEIFAENEEKVALESEEGIVFILSRQEFDIAIFC